MFEKAIRSARKRDGMFLSAAPDGDESPQHGTRGAAIPTVEALGFRAGLALQKLGS
jgi:hypothetical protein